MHITQLNSNYIFSQITKESSTVNNFLSDPNGTWRWSVIQKIGYLDDMHLWLDSRR